MLHVPGSVTAKKNVLALSAATSTKPRWSVGRDCQLMMHGNRARRIDVWRLG